MENEEIIELYWQRNEKAILLSQEQHGAACFTMANRILHSIEDSEECVNDTWLHAWNGIPPARPHSLRAFLLKITRNLALNRWDMLHAQKRGGGQVEELTEELQASLPSPLHTEEAVLARELSDVVADFLRSMSKGDQALFLRRYFYMQTIREIADALDLTDAMAAMRLSRIRKKLRHYLRKEYAL